MDAEQSLHGTAGCRVSIIVPVYNVERFLDECVGSLVAQTHRNLQIILIDDASSDSSPRLCDEWAAKDDRILVFHLAEGRGASGARNVGLDHAEGEYVMFVDSDDVLDSTAVEFCVGKAEHLRCGMVIFGKSLIDEGGKRIRDYVIDADVTARNNSSDYYTNLSDLMRQDYLNPPWGKLFSRKLVEDVRFDESMVYEEDLFFVLETLRNHPDVYASDRPLYGYRHMDTGMATVFRREKSLNVVQANRRKLAFFKDHLHAERVKANLSFTMANDIGWVIPMIRNATGVNAHLKAEYVMEMTGDRQLRPFVLDALRKAWMTRVQKLLIASNKRGLWRIYMGWGK